ncbi:MAG: hypothetical protein M3541_01720 [Acidobacteriota bacterium]|nr:hypothetical protein [Acidobacteriota bacterium]MDQ3417494.1 hypothetical protein [Acidobacteriota bacterium]
MTVIDLSFVAAHRTDGFAGGDPPDLNCKPAASGVVTVGALSIPYHRRNPQTLKAILP